MSEIGARLQAARERAHLSLFQAAEKLHVDPEVIQALEKEQFGTLGAEVYARGHLRRYAELVRESAPELLALYSSRGQSGPPPDLTLMPHARLNSPVRGLLVVTGLALVIGVGLAGSIRWVYLTLHAPVAAPVLLSHVPPPLPAAEPEPTPVTQPPVAQAHVAPAAPPATAHAPLVKPSPRPLVAEATVTLKFRSSCWTEVHDAHGGQLYRAIGSAGDVAKLHGPAPLRVMVGNFAVVDVEVNGHAQAIPAQAQNGRSARFLVTQNGELQPIPAGAKT